MQSKAALFSVSVGAVFWIVWCFLVVTSVVPWLLRKLTVYPDVAAWVLCIAPVVLAAVVVISRLPDEDEA